MCVKLPGPGIFVLLTFLSPQVQVYYIQSFLQSFIIFVRMYTFSPALY